MDTVALDVEMVVLKERHGKDKNAPALVVVVGPQCKVLYHKYVYHRAIDIDFKTLYYTSRNVNGITYANIKNFGYPLRQVQEELRALLKDKKVIVCGGHNDFYALRLPIENFDVFDLHSHFWKLSYIGMPQPIGLKSLVWHFFNKDMRPNLHNPIDDANETLKLYLFIIKCHVENNISGPFNNIKTIK